MAITVNFYTNKSDNRCLTKNLKPIAGAQNVSCDVYQPCDRLDPILIIDRDRFNIDTVNYCEIPDFGRKYFITGVEGKSGNKVHMSCHVDVLGTYDEDLRNCPLVAARSTNNVNYFLQDDMRLFNSYVYNQYINIGQDLTEPDILYLITM